MMTFCKTRSRVVTLVLLAAMLVSLFSACGASEPEETTPVETTSETDAVTSISEETTSVVTSETETTTDTPESTTAAPEPTVEPVDFAGVWAEVTDVRLVEVGLTHEVGGYNDFDMEIAYLLYKGDGEIIEKLATIFAEPVTEYGEADAWWQESQPDLVLNTDPDDYQINLCQSSDANGGEPAILPLCYCDVEGVRYVFELDADELEYLEEIVRNVRIKSYNTAAESTGTAGASGEELVEIQRYYLGGIWGYSCDQVDIVEIKLTSSDKLLAEELASCFEETELTHVDDGWYRTSRTLRIKLPDGRNVNALYSLGLESGSYELDGHIYIVDDGDTQFYDMSENSLTKLSSLLEKTVISYAEN